MRSLLDLLLTVIGGAAVGGAIVAALGKRLVDHQLAKAMEAVKSELTQRTEALKTELSIYAHQHTVALSRVDSLRAEAIHRIYKSMREWQDALTLLTSETTELEPTDADVYGHAREATTAAHNAGAQFTRTLADEALYIDAATYDRVRISTEVGLQAVAALAEHIRAAEYFQVAEDVVGEIEKQRKEVALLVQREVAPALDELVSEFRRLLRSA